MQYANAERGVCSSSYRITSNLTVTVQHRKAITELSQGYIAWYQSMGVAEITCIDGRGKRGDKVHIDWGEGLSNRSMACCLSSQKVSRSCWNEIYGHVEMFLINAPHPMAEMRKSRSNCCSVFCSTVWSLGYVSIVFTTMNMYCLAYC